jgi:hypothetical protein
MSTNSRKPYDRMTTAKLRAATAEYDREQPGVVGKPLTPAQRKAFRATAKRGRPRVGRGADKVLLSIERGLLNQADALAKRRKLNRSQLFAAALRAELTRDRSADATRSPPRPSKAGAA